MKFIILAIFTVMAVGGQMLNPIQLPYSQYYQKPLTLDPYYPMNYPYPPTFYPYPVNYFQAALEFPQSQELPLVQDSEIIQDVPEIEEVIGETSLGNLTLEFPQSQELPLVQDSETAQEVPEMEEGDGEPSLKNSTLAREGRGSCCKRIKVDYRVGYGNKGARRAIRSRYGYYYRAKGSYGGRSWYYSSNRKSAVWYHGGRWKIGSIRGVGRSYCNAYVSSSARCPYGPDYSWRFYSRGSWYNAGQSLSIWCK